MWLGFAGLPVDLAASHVKMMHFSVKILEKDTVPFCLESKFIRVVFEVDLLMHWDLCFPKR